MADMNTRHHQLIADAVAEAIIKMESHKDVAEWIQQSGQSAGEIDRMTRLVRFVLARTKTQLIASFAERLRYTHDKFEPRDFEGMVNRIVTTEHLKERAA